jgi:hypothetical protein
MSTVTWDMVERSKGIYTKEIKKRQHRCMREAREKWRALCIIS